MSIINRIILAVVMVGLATAAYGDGITSGVSPQLGGGIDYGFDGGISGHHGTITPPAAGSALLLLFPG